MSEKTEQQTTAEKPNNPDAAQETASLKESEEFERLEKARPKQE